MARIIQKAVLGKAPVDATKIDSEKPFSGIGVKVTGLQKVAASSNITDADMELINQFTLKPLTAKDVAIYTLQVCGDQIDRDGERFSIEVLHDFADTLPGKGLLEAHQWGPVGVGLFYRAWVENIDGVNWVMGQCYLPKASEESAEMITKIDSGIAKWVSIGFYAPCRCPIYDEDAEDTEDKASPSGQPVYPTNPSPLGLPMPDMGMNGEPDCIEYQRGADGERAESLECSLVFLGAQYDAAVVKSMANRLEEAAIKDGRVLSGRNLDKLKQARDAVHEVITMHEAHHGDGKPPMMEDKVITRISDSVFARIKQMFTGGGIDGSLETVTVKPSSQSSEDQKGEFEMDAKELKQAVDSQVKAVFEAMGFDVDEIKSAVTTIKSVVGEISGLKKALKDFGDKVTAQIDASDELAERVSAVEGSLNDSETKDKDGKAVKVEGLASSVKALIAVKGETDKAFDEVDSHLTNIYAVLGVPVGEADDPSIEVDGAKGADGKPKPSDQHSNYKDKGARPASGGKTTADIFGDTLTPPQLVRKA